MTVSRWIRASLAALCATLFSFGSAAAQDLDPCDAMDAAVASGDYPTALEELDWCKRAIEDLHFEKLGEILSVTIQGHEPGEPEVEGILGINALKIVYSGQGSQVQLNLAGGTPGGADSALGGLGGLAGLASAFGQRQTGVEQIRIAGTTGRLEETSDGFSLLITLDNGSILTLEGPSADLVRGFAEEVIPTLDAYLG